MSTLQWKSYAALQCSSVLLLMLVFQIACIGKIPTMSVFWKEHRYKRFILLSFSADNPSLDPPTTAQREIQIQQEPSDFVIHLCPFLLNRTQSKDKLLSNWIVHIFISISLPDFPLSSCMVRQEIFALTYTLGFAYLSAALSSAALVQVTLWLCSQLSVLKLNQMCFNVWCQDLNKKYGFVFVLFF